MKMRFLATAAAVFLIGVTQANAQAQAQAQAEGDAIAFRFGGVGFEMRLPDGFCAPAGTAIDAVQLITVIDEQNATLAAAYPCANNVAEAEDYYVVKAPVEMMRFEVTLAELFEYVLPVVQSPEFEEQLRAVPGEVERGLGRVTQDERQVSGALHFAGSDDRCIYLAGRMSVRVGEQQSEKSGATCITVAGNRIMSIIRYSGDSVEPKDLLPSARALAEAITPVTTD